MNGIDQNEQPSMFVQQYIYITASHQLGFMPELKLVT